MKYMLYYMLNNMCSKICDCQISSTTAMLQVCSPIDQVYTLGCTVTFSSGSNRENTQNQPLLVIVIVIVCSYQQAQCQKVRIQLYPLLCYVQLYLQRVLISRHSVRRSGYSYTLCYVTYSYIYNVFLSAGTVL